MSLKKAALIERHLAYSDRISAQVRLISFGLLATTWGLLIGQVQALGISEATAKKHLIFIGAMAILTMFLDFLQYVCSYVNSKAALDEMDRTGKEEGEYTKDFFYRAGVAFFWCKQLFLAVSAMWFLGCIALWLFPWASAQS